MKKDIKIISVGGSIIIPKTGFDVKFLKKFRELILSHVKNGTKFILVVGGGGTCRQYQEALRKTVKVDDKNLDWLGIYSTWLNADFVRLMFGEFAASVVIKDPTDKKILKQVQDDKIIIAGGWKPGWSTDMDAVLLAKNFGASEVINLSNIDYVYDKDPNKFKLAKKITKSDWKSFRKNVVGNKWDPGKNAPFDPIASKEAQKLGLKVAILRGTNLKEVDKCISGGDFKGTLIF